MFHSLYMQRFHLSTRCQYVHFVKVLTGEVHLFLWECLLDKVAVSYFLNLMLKINNSVITDNRGPFHTAHLIKLLVVQQGLVFKLNKTNYLTFYNTIFSSDKYESYFPFYQKMMVCFFPAVASF